MAHVPDSAQRALKEGDHIWFSRYVIQNENGRLTLVTWSAPIVRCTPTFVWWTANSWRDVKERREDVYLSQEASIRGALIEAGQSLIREQENHERRQEWLREQIEACKRALEEASDA